MTERKIISKTTSSLKPTAPVTEISDRYVQQACRDLLDTLEAEQERLDKIHPGKGCGVGLAANQIEYPYEPISEEDARPKEGFYPQDFVPPCIYVVSIREARAAAEQCEVVPASVYINAKITPLSEAKTMLKEGCLSVNGFTGHGIPRFSSIEVNAFNEKGERITVKADNFIARVHQHETDHNGGLEYLNHLNFNYSELLAIKDWIERPRQHAVTAPQWVIPGKLECMGKCDTAALLTWCEDAISNFELKLRQGIPLSQLRELYKEKIKSPQVYPTSALEICQARAAAFILGDENAINFLDRTYHIEAPKQEQVHLEPDDTFVICSIQQRDNSCWVEYKIYDRDGKERKHCFERYEILTESAVLIETRPALVRVIGDPVLHEAGKPFYNTDKNRTQLEQQIAIAKEILIKTSGAGIAANQCCAINDPYCFTIVGVVSDAHRAGVEKRYPGAKFPDAMIMVNPKITSISTEQQSFNHACLSVPSSNKCAVSSPESITVEYVDPSQNMIKVTKTLTGVDAVVLWHELNHILYGKTYIDTALSRLKKDDFAAFEDRVNKELLIRQQEGRIPDLTIPPFHFTITLDEQGESQLDVRSLQDALPKLKTEILLGILLQCQKIKKTERALIFMD